jgi:serine/threonine-protein kinase HipA
MKTLYVFFENERVGELRQSDELTYSFVYDESWQKNKNAFPLSLSLPLDKVKFGNKTTLSFFENLLPEGELRDKLERSHNVKGPFDFLEKFGLDCAGAVILTAHKDYAKTVDVDKVKKVNMKRVYEAIEKHRSVAEVVAGMNPGYLSLAGAQDKFPAIYKDGEFYLPLKGGPTTHIVKAPIHRQGVKESVFNEYYCMRLAGLVGLNVPACKIVPGPSPLFVIERYDREEDSEGHVHRLHQQDFCQAQGLTSANKYEIKGGPTLKQNYDLIIAHVAAKKRPEAIEQFIRWVCFNLFIGNNDSHSKNISFLLRQNKVELAPFYDLLSTDLYEGLKKNFSFKIGGRDKFSQIGQNQIAALEAGWDLKAGTFTRYLNEMHDQLMQNKDQLANEILKTHKKVKIIKRISQLIADRAKGLKNQKAI